MYLDLRTSIIIINSPISGFMILRVILIFLFEKFCRNFKSNHLRGVPIIFAKILRFEFATSRLYPYPTFCFNLLQFDYAVISIQ